MAVKLRLTRVGRKKSPTYRLVVADQRMKRDGRVIETVGLYEPKKQPHTFTFNKERVDYWVAKGAQPSATVGRLLKESARAPKPTAE